jgi:alpha-tubulin suppressor-like RCC1 family protein
MRNRHLFGVGAAVVLVGAIVIIPTAGVAGAAPKPPKPKVSGFAASPAALYDNGGPVLLSANVTNATSCVFTSTKPITGLPATVACTSGAVSQTVVLPANAGKKAVKYKFELSVTGTKTVKAKANVTVTTIAGLKGVRSVASDQGGYCAVLSTGGVDCWGFNDYGQLGDGTIDLSDTPVAVTGITNAVSVTSDGYGYCAVLSTGAVDCWGSSNGYGELGNGTTGGSETPQTVTGITDAVSVTSESDSDGYGYCAVLSTGRVDCWGDNTYGELGNGTIGGPDGEDGYDTPQAVTGITDAASLTGNFLDGGDGFCAVLSSGGVDCWGDNQFGELGNGTVDGPDGEDGYDYDTPQPVTGITDAVSVTVGGDYDGSAFCAVLSTGGVDCWGDNTYGELGNATVGGPDGCDSGDYCYDTPQVVSGITDAVSLTSGVSAGPNYCAVLSTGGVDCWGDNTYGELGNGTIDGPDGIGGYDKPQAVTGLTVAVSVTSNGNGYCGVLSAGGMDCWGFDGNGELGNGTTDGPDGIGGYDTPQAVTGITNAVSALTDSEGYCAVLSTGGMGCWGNDTYGQLGNGTTVGAVGTPTLDDDIPQTVSP